MLREREDQSRDDLDFLNVETSFLVFDFERDLDRECDFERERRFRDRDLLLLERLLLRERRLRERDLKEFRIFFYFL